MPRPVLCHNIADFRRAAERRLPAPIYHYLEGGADDECTVARNRDAYAQFEFVPRALRDVRSVDTACRVFGKQLSAPLLLAPVGMNRMFHKDGELGVARAAKATGVGFSLSTMATTSMEAIKAIDAPVKLFQLYLLNKESHTTDVIDRCKAAGFDGLCLTVDTVVPGNRERDIRTGLTVPPRLSPQSVLDFARRPRWVLDYCLGERFDLPNIVLDDKPGQRGLSNLPAFFNKHMTRSLSWEGAENLIRHWDGPFAIKGILAPEDARRALEIGATAVILSNHGGRQLDCSSPAIEALPHVAAEVGGKMDIIVDGGIVRGSQVIKALALGATACMVGRSYVYGLSSHGQVGVEAVVNVLKQEMERTMALVGCATLSQLEPGYLRRAGSPYMGLAECT